MKANEFVKKFDLRRVFKWINSDLGRVHSYIIKDAGYWVCYSNKDQKGAVLIEDLKRLVESHELIESCGGLQSVGEKLTHGMYESRAVIDRLKQAILDVESCQ